MHRAIGKILVTPLLVLLGTPVVAVELDEVVALMAAGSHEQALQRLAGQPESRRSRLLKADALAALERGEEAEAIYHTLIDEAPEDPVPYNNLANFYAASGRLQEASDLLNQAMKSDQRYATIYDNLSRVYVEMSRNAYAKALRIGESRQGVELTSLDLKDDSGQQPRVHLAAGNDEADKVSDADNKEEAIKVLQKWAAAWSAQDVEAYLAAYDQEFRPKSGISLSQWQEQRRFRLHKPNRIEVALSDFEVEKRNSSELVVKLLQRYRSDRYRDSSRKGFVLVQRNGGWKIRDEYTIEVIN